MWRGTPMFGNVTALVGLHVTGKYRGKKHWVPHTHGAREAQTLLWAGISVGSSNAVEFPTRPPPQNPSRTLGIGLR